MYITCFSPEKSVCNLFLCVCVCECESTLTKVAGVVVVELTHSGRCFAVCHMSSMFVLKLKCLGEQGGSKVGKKRT